MTDQKPKTGAGAIPKKRKLKSAGTFVYNDMIDSAAMLALAASKTGYPMLVYLHFRQTLELDHSAKNRKEGHQRRKFWNEREITFAYSTAEDLGINSRAFRNAIDRLIELGFIDVVKPGNGLMKGDCTIYGISERWRKYGTDEFEPASREKAYYGFCSRPKANCPKCVHTAGGQRQECLLPGDPPKADGRCRRFEEWINP